MRPTPRALCALVASAALYGSCLGSESPPIRTRLHSDFASPPLLLELAEAISAHNSSSYFPFILKLAHNRELFADSDAAAYRTAQTWVTESHLLERFARELVQLELATHVYAPMVAAQYQMYDAMVVPDLVRARGESEFDAGCSVWAQFKDRQACSVGALEKMLEVETFYGDTYVEQAQVEPEVLALDHVYPASNSGSPPPQSSRVVALYADPRAETFIEMHDYLAALAENSEITYVLRYRPWAPDGGSADGHPALGLSGYGVELALKSTEYKVIDDRELNYKDSKDTPAATAEKTVDPRAAGNGTYGGREFVIFKKEHEEEAVVKGLSEKQVADLDIQATQMVLSAAPARQLAMLKQLAQNLPRYAHHLSAVPLNSTLAAKIRSNPPSSHRARVLINGLELDADDTNPFSLLEHLRRENAVISGLEHLGLAEHQAVDLLFAADASIDAADDNARLTFDVRDKSTAQKTIWWLNDLEKDKRYAAWPADLQNLRRMAGPGMVQRLRRNLVQVLFALDLAEPDSWVLVLEELMANVEHGLPMQFGIAPLINYAALDQRAAADTMAKLVLYLRRAFGRKEWQSVVKGALVAHYRGKNTGSASATTFAESMQGIYEAYIKSHDTKKGRSPLTWEQIAAIEPPSGGDQGDDDDRDDAAWLAQRWGDTVAYCRRLDLSALSPSLVFVNGEQFSMGSNYQQHVFGAFQMQTWEMAQKLRSGELAADDDIPEFVYGRGALPGRSTLIYVSDEHPLRILPLGAPAAVQWMDRSVRYLGSSDAESVEQVVSMWVVGDLASGRVRRVAADALAAMAKDGRIRVALVHASQAASAEEIGDQENQDEDEGEEHEGYDVDAPQVIHQLVASGVDARAVLAYLSGASDAAAELLGEDKAELLQPQGEFVDAAETRFAANRAVLSSLDAVPSHADSCCVVVNGRIIPEITRATAVSEDTLVQLALLELRERITAVHGAISGILPDIPAASMPDMLLKVSAIVEHGRTLFAPRSVLHRSSKTQARQTIEDLDISGLVGPLRLGGGGDESPKLRIRIQAVLDPLSEAAQKWTAFFETLLDRPNYSVELWLAPQPKLDELPVKRFYRYLWPSRLEFDSAERTVQPEVVFRGIPADPLLTLGMDVPSAWLVTATDSVHDLDNIRLSSVKDQEAGISATYTLANILVEGHLVDSSSRAPARGLEVQLGTALEPAMTDTIVMANLGYLQLKANPGVWRFAIRPGRSADIYKMEHIGEGRWDYQAARAMGADAEDRRPVLVTSFGGATIFPLVSKRKGRENDDVLDDGSAEKSGPSTGEGKAAGGLWGKLRGSLGVGGSSADVAVPKNAPPHFDVFAVASGHLYERLLSIMITSVLNSTTSHVKFWLIENFLSPSFKSFVPHMAREFGFDYEFVTYKWPHWLNHETEKQRTIWGYKILFLDVLFPLSLDRVIFVDADQIVRADLQELASMDLEGAPYGYVPFCNDREDIEGYRFWKHGWWKDHLRGKPYHISALYVVDLRRFRQLAAGDRLRGQYQMLSRDANSLANLDQDLPNNMQHLVPIFSLPQEWLWCETWCSDEALARAKTIDLCNNPMTKEPKLVRARRLLPEWEVYDKKVADFTKLLAQRGSHEGAQIADAEAVNIDQQPVDAEESTPVDTEKDKLAAENNKHDEL